VRAIVAPCLGGPWQLREVADPEPGPGEVLVRVEASGICHTDLYQCANPAYGTAFPRIPGHEPVGRVVALGEGVRGLAGGDRVGGQITQRFCGVCRYCANGREEMCEAGPEALGVHLDGGHAELVVLRAAAVEPVPDGLPAPEAAPVFCAGYTVYSALRDTAVQPGERLAVHGIGGLGHLAVQYARALGADVVAVTASAVKARAIAELGAAEALVASGAAVGDALRDAGPFDVLVLCGTSIEPSALAALRPYGRVSLCGVTEDVLPLNARDAIHRKLSVFGSSHGPRERLREALALHVAASARTVVETYPLERARDAYTRVASGQVRFRAVLVPDG
jgi:D-arabinose 1-dehydrogenase-like Zn-dependent alcohol dehydrogenase